MSNSEFKIMASGFFAAVGLLVFLFRSGDSVPVLAYIALLCATIWGAGA